MTGAGVLAAAQLAQLLGEIPFMSSSSPSALLAAWQSGVRARGGAPTRIPPGLANVGALAARFLARAATSTTKAVYRYELAPAALRKWDEAERAQLAREIDNGSTLTKRIATTVRETAHTVVEAPPKILRDALGIPTWVIPAAVGVGLVLYLRDRR